MRKAWLPTLIFLVCVVAGSGSERELDPSKSVGADSLFPIHYGEKWGFILRDGQIAIPPQFDWVDGGFFHGLGRVHVKHNLRVKVGYVDSAGRFVIDPVFDAGGDFRKGLAPVRVGKLWGFIDRTGDFVVQPSFQTAGEFHEGLARVMYCPPETRIPPLMDYPILRDSFRLEVEAGSLFAGRNVRFGFIDRTGKMQIEPQAWEMADDFSEGLAWVRGRDLKCGYVNRQGQFAFPRRFDHVKPFSEGLASVSVEPKCGYIDKSGEFAIPARFDYCGNFSEGLAVVREASADEDELETMGAIDRSGRYVIPPQYYRLKDFSEGLAIASRNRQKFFIDRRGKKVHITDHQIADLRIEWWGFRDGLAIVGTKGKRVYIDKTGKVVAAFEK